MTDRDSWGVFETNELYKKKVFDIGCGMGQHALQYSKKGALSVLGIDISEKMLAYARKNNAASNIEYRRLAYETDL